MIKPTACLSPGSLSNKQLAVAKPLLNFMLQVPQGFEAYGQYADNYCKLLKAIHTYMTMINEICYRL
jgi:hypothetical protein